MRLRHVVALLALLAIATVVGLSLGDSDDTSPDETTGPKNSADRLIFWTDCEQIVSLSDEELDEWSSRGVDGFACMIGRLQGLGGTEGFTGDPTADLSGEGYSLQRSIRDSRIVQRADERGMKLYLGAFLANTNNAATPLVDWFDDGGWTGQVVPRMRELAAAARLLGFAGVAFDQELYPQANGATTATWDWDYPGNTHSETEVRAQVKERGAELMTALLEDFPDLELAVYHFAFPGDWQELVREEVSGNEGTSTKTVHIDFWDGMTSVEGYRAIRFWDSIFYKVPHRGSWEEALTYNQNRVQATLSQHLSNWDYASERVYVSPFSWIDSGPEEGEFDDALPPDEVEEQLLAFRKWGMGGEFANFVFGSLTGFDYSPYLDALREASSPANVDDQAPEVTVTSAPDSAPAEEIQGSARDDLAIRAVRWRDDRGGSGAAELTWEVLSGDYDSGYEWEMRWSIDADEIAAGATEVTITAEDIKENESAPAVYSLAGA